jgi:hypothetical protein
MPNQFNLNETLAEMATAIQGEVADNWNEVRTVANEFLNRKKERLSLLADLRLSGELSQKKFESRLADEKLVLEAELHAIVVIGKAIAQRAANAAMDVLQKAVKAAVRAVL